VQEQVDKTYIMVKPDGVQRGLVSILISCSGFRHWGMKQKIINLKF